MISMTDDVPDLFSGLPEGALTPAQRRTLYARVPVKRGHYARPGSGPAGETCGTCQHYRTVCSGSGKTFRKCKRAEGAWTQGPGSDIRKKDPACCGWERVQPVNKPRT
jgi:hypothetical protein